MDVFIAASHARLGDTEMARRTVRALETDYPEFPSQKWLSRGLVDEAQLADTTALLANAGLQLLEPANQL